MPIVNYTPEMEELLKNLYNELGNNGLPKIADQLNKTVPSVRAKLVKLGVYIPNTNTPIRRNGPTKKELLRDLVKAGYPEEGTVGLEPCSKEAIAFLLNYVAQGKTNVT